MSTYDDFKLATPPEYEREEAGAPAAGLPEGPRCPFYEDKPGCDRAVCPVPPPCEPEEDIKW